MHWKSIWAAGVAVFMVACGSSSSGGGGSGGTWSCNIAGGICVQVSGQNVTSAQVTQIQNACTSGGSGTFATSACPSASRVGSCALPSSNPYGGGVSGVTVTYVMYSPTFDTTTGPQTCTALGGTWTAG